MSAASRHSTWPFVGSVLTLALGAAAVILLIPGVVQGRSDVSVWALAVLAGIALVGAVGAFRWRPGPTS